MQHLTSCDLRRMLPAVGDRPGHTPYLRSPTSFLTDLLQLMSCSVFSQEFTRLLEIPLRHSTQAFVCACAFLASACGGGSKSSSSSTPSTPTTPSQPVQQNRAPVVNSMTITPTFGVSELTAFTYIASASDPDGDALTYTWNLAGSERTGAGGSITFVGDGIGEVRVTVSDGRGATATDLRTITVGNMTGSWAFTVPGQGTLNLFLTQSTTLVSGTFVVAPGGFGNVAPGVSGRTDPAQPGRIDGNASVEIRLKVGPFTDFTLRGTMDSTGRRVTGGLFGSGFSGQPFTMTKQ